MYCDLSSQITSWETLSETLENNGILPAMLDYCHLDNTSPLHHALHGYALSNIYTIDEDDGEFIVTHAALPMVCKVLDIDFDAIEHLAEFDAFLQQKAQKSALPSSEIFARLAHFRTVLEDLDKIDCSSLALSMVKKVVEADKLFNIAQCSAMFTGG